jgi:hypothetical protein
VPQRKPDPPATVPGQPYPHPFRARGAMSAPEERFEITGATTHVHRWTYGGGWTRRDFKTRTRVHASAAAAHAALDAMVAARIKEDWAPLPSWPELPVPWIRSTPAAPPPPRLPPKFSTLPFSKIHLLKRATPVGARDVASFGDALRTDAPPTWEKLVRTFGGGAFCGRLNVYSPADAVRATKRRRRHWKDEHGRASFRNYDDAIGNRAASLVTIGHSIDGDEIVFVAGAPKTSYILPRHYDVVMVAKDLPRVLGFYFQVAKDTDGVERATFAPGVTL